MGQRGIFLSAPFAFALVHSQPLHEGAVCKIILIFIPAIVPLTLARVRRIEVQAKSLLTVMNMRQTKLTLILCILALGLALLCSISSCSSRKTDDKNPLAQLVDPLIGSATSFHDYKFPIRIDYVFSSKSLKAANYFVNREIGYSDHYPVFADFYFEK